MDAHGMPVRFLITEGTAADCTQTCALIEGIPAKYLLADCGYDCNKTIEKALARHCDALCQYYLVFRCCPNSLYLSPSYPSYLTIVTVSKTFEKNRDIVFYRLCFSFVV